MGGGAVARLPAAVVLTCLLVLASLRFTSSSGRKEGSQLQGDHAVWQAPEAGRQQVSKAADRCGAQKPRRQCTNTATLCVLLPRKKKATLKREWAARKRELRVKLAEEQAERARVLGLEDDDPEIGIQPQLQFITLNDNRLTKLPMLFGGVTTTA